MSMDMISPVLKQLSAIVVQEANLSGSLAQEFQHIVDELGHMRAFLAFAGGREEVDPRLEEWISQVRDVTYDAQDVVDEYLLRFSHHHGLARKFINSINNLRSRHEIASKIQAIRSRIINISESHKRYLSEYDIPNQVSASSSSAVNNSLDDYRDAALLVDEARLVGINHPKQSLISQLLDGISELKVVSVFGMGGLGKTTLVKKVQEDADIKRHFQIVCWVTVSQTFDMKDLLKGLIQQLHQEIGKPVPQEVSSSMTSTHQLKLLIKNFLCGKRYLIVFDDVWDSKFWDAVKFALPDGNCGSRVMATTRIIDVARASTVEFQSCEHEMQPLSSVDSWTLFCKRIFNDERCPAHLVNVAKEILEKCNGMPLTIVIIGGVLALKDKTKVDEWKTLARSLGNEMEANGKLDIVGKILCLSYNDLPYHLKVCLLYVSIFPEDHEIDEDRLIRLWIAEGFVEEKTRMSKYEVGQGYLNELVNRSLIQVTFNVATERVCGIHDLVREVLLAKLSRQNFAAIATGEQTGHWTKRVRRLGVHDFEAKTLGSVSCKYLRALVAFESEQALSKHCLSKLLKDARLLKVLDLEGTQLKKIPEQIFRLYHLKTLSLRDTDIKVIPKSIGSLKNLEFLDLSRTKVKKLPKEILNLRQLVHLLVSCAVEERYWIARWGCVVPGNITKLLSLERLSYVGASDTLIRKIGEVKQLRVLGISRLRRKDGKQLCSSLGKLSNLVDLTLGSDETLELEDLNSSVCSNLQNLQALSLGGHLRKLPQLVSSLQELAIISLCHCQLMEDPLESLQHLPNLLFIQLIEAFEGERLCFKAGCFLKLQKLSLEGLGGLRWLRVEEGVMPNLREVRLASLKSLEEFPRDIQYLTKLEVLNLVDMNEKVMAPLQNQDEDSEVYKIISGIPEVVLWDDESGWCRYPQQYWETC